MTNYTLTAGKGTYNLHAYHKFPKGTLLYVSTPERQAQFTRWSENGTNGVDKVFTRWKPE